MPHPIRTITHGAASSALNGRPATATTANGADVYERTGPSQGARPPAPHLPNELLLNIFADLPHRTLMRCADVNRAWRRVAESMLMPGPRIADFSHWTVEDTARVWRESSLLRRRTWRLHLPKNMASLDEALGLVRMLQQAHGLAHLHMDHTDMGTWDLDALVAALPPGLLGIGFRRCNLSVARMTELLRKLPASVRHVDLSQNGSQGTPAEAESFAHALSRVTHVSLQRCDFNGAFLASFLQALRRRPAPLEGLHLDGVSTDRWALAALLKVLPTHDLRLSGLHHPRMDVDDWGALALITALPRTLQVFSMADPRGPVWTGAMVQAFTKYMPPALRAFAFKPGYTVGWWSMVALLNALPDTLEHLHIPPTFMMGSLARALATRQLPALRSLDAAYDGDTDADVVALRAIWASRTTVSLMLPNLTVEGLRQLWPYLRPDLQVLLLSGARAVGSAGVRDLCGRWPTSLRELYLADMGLDDTTALYLRRHLPADLHYLDVHGNNLRPMTVIALRMAKAGLVVRAEDQPEHLRCADCVCHTTPWSNDTLPPDAASAPELFWPLNPSW